jgi:hypothetical protein
MMSNLVEIAVTGLAISEPAGRTAVAPHGAQAKSADADAGV